ncbi:PH domain-containing protein [Natronobiforma cellulositropha]|uniref:PH domain-containing protein n=1 Tax=Natronobiforma cellulositropha TaxID=1679076 RepID=UPI0021D57B56|nr:PH domain-containing protein [Natronobiforma cellulositropha]
MSDAEPAGRTDGGGRSDDSEEGPPVWLPLATGESVRWIGGPRIQTAYPWLALGVVGVLAGVLALVVDGIPILASLVALLAVPTAVWGWLAVDRVAFVVTTDALYVRSGVVGVRVRALALERVQNTATRQHALARALGYGTITVETAGGDEPLRFWNVEHPGEVRALVDDRVSRAQGEAVPGSHAQWEAVLEDVRGWRRALERE